MIRDFGVASQIVAMLAIASLGGCGMRPSAEPLNEELARASLKAALDGWKRGASPDSLRKQSPPVIAQDQDWLAGARLVDYEFAGDGRRTADNLFVPVRLTVRMKAKKPETKTVTYVTGTSPQVMVFRMIREGPSEGDQ